MSGTSVAFEPVRVAVLLTDIEGSTRLWQEHAAVMPVVLMEHHHAVAEVVAAHEGRLPPDQGEGDARLAVFLGEGAGRAAVTAALTLQERLGALTLPSRIRLRVRMAVDVGDVVEYEGNVFGTVVNGCARLRGLAHGGQLLITDSVVEACRGEVPGDLTDLGTHRLRDIAGPVHVLQVDPAGRPQVFAPLVGVTSTPVVLPELDGPVVGRQAETTQLVTLLADRQLVTITGAGGSGKTTLAVEAARSAASSFPGGVYFVDLVPVSSPSDVGRRIAEVLGAADEASDAWHAVADRAQGGRPLLVLDNCEHLAHLGAELTGPGHPVLRSCTLLATSRRPLGLPSERVLPVGPLEPPPADTGTRLELEASSAGVLLVARALESNPRLDVDEVAADLAWIARRLDGIPLALELAAARLRLQGVGDLRASLETSLTALDDITGRRPERQRALVETLAWSIDGLDLDAARLLAAAAVFADSPTLDALATVAGMAPRDALAPLSRLLDASLVRAVERADAVPRFSVLVPVREYVLDVTDPATRDELADRHADYHLAWARDGSQLRHNTDRDWEWIVETGVMRADALQALDRVLDTRPDLAAEFAVHLAALWFEHGERDRARAALNRAVEVSPDPSAVYPQLAACLRWWGDMGQDPDGEQIAVLLAAAERSGDERLLAFVCFLRGWWGVSFGHLTSFDSDLDRALALVNGYIEEERGGRRPLSGMSSGSFIRNVSRASQANALAWSDPVRSASLLESILAGCRGPRDFDYASTAVDLARVLCSLGDTERAEQLVTSVDSLGFSIATRRPAAPGPSSTIDAGSGRRRWRRRQRRPTRASRRQTRWSRGHCCATCTCFAAMWPRRCGLPPTCRTTRAPGSGSARTRTEHASRWLEAMPRRPSACWTAVRRRCHPIWQTRGRSRTCSPGP